MAWAERTIHTVTPASESVNHDEEDRINKILKNMPPFIKLSSRRARKTLAKYEEVKQRHIENLRNNPVFKFVMMVSGFTNENMQKYWKGSDVSPFQEGYGPKDVKIDREEIRLLVRRARERALADLHQFCRPITAIPMYRRARTRVGDYDKVNHHPVPYSPPRNRSQGASRTPNTNRRRGSNSGMSAPQSVGNSPQSNQGSNISSSSNRGPESPPLAPRGIKLLSTPNIKVKQESQEDSSVSPSQSVVSSPVRPISNSPTQGLDNNVPDTDYANADATAEDIPRERHNRAVDTNEAIDLKSHTKYIYNMSDMEFRDFCSLFKSELFSTQKAFDKAGDNRIERYILGSQDIEDQPVNFPAHKHQRRSNLEVPWNGVNRRPENELDLNANHDNQGVDRVFDETHIYDRYDEQQNSYDHRNPYVSVQRTNWMDWSNNQTVVHWDDETTAGYWFQRYIARWLVEEERSGNVMADEERFGDLRAFRNKYGILFNNLFLKDKRQWWRDLTGLRLTKLIRSWEGYEGELDHSEPHNIPFEVPLDFVQPLFNERFAFWKHELVLGEYEKRTMYEADQWLQKTPWAIGKIYLQPNIYSHMQEAHIAISSKFKKFEGLSLQDWLTSEKHMFFYAKLVALCIRTSAVLSNKKYGLDKAYMRLNLEKRRVMFSLSKMETPKRMPVARLFPRASANRERLWENYRSARARGDVAEAQRILQALN